MLNLLVEFQMLMGWAESDAMMLLKKHCKLTGGASVLEEVVSTLLLNTKILGPWEFKIAQLSKLLHTQVLNAKFMHLFNHLFNLS